MASRAVPNPLLLALASGAALTILLIAWAVLLFSPMLPDCPMPVPLIHMRMLGGSGEMVFQVGDSDFHPAPRVSELAYELAFYPEGTDLLGPGELFAGGPLSSLNTTGTFQFHDMGAEGEFSPGNDFFILKDPPGFNVQLRIIDESGTPISWNLLWGCI